MKRLLTDKPYREELIANGYAHAQQFRGEALTNQMMKLYQQVIGEEDFVPEAIT